MTTVLFRHTHNDLIAVFPFMSRDFYWIPCYSHWGQHGTTTWDWIRYNTRPAKPEQYETLLNELRSIGYNDLEVINRLPSYRTIMTKESELWDN